MSHLKVPGYRAERYRQQQQTATSPVKKNQNNYILDIYIKFLEELTMAALLQMPHICGVPIQSKEQGYS